MQIVHTKYLAAIMIGGSLLVTGCKSSAPAPAATPVASTTTAANPNEAVTAPGQTGQQPMAVRNPDGSITNPDGSVTYPPGSQPANRENGPNSNVAAERASVASSETAAKPVVRRTVPAGTPIHVRLNGGLAASRNNVGDRWTGTLSQAVVSRGETIYPRGTEVSGEVVAAKGKGRFKGAGGLGIELTYIARDRVHTSEYEQVGKGRGKRTAGFVGGGAGIGALIGGLAGGGKGALLGGLAGGGAGTAAGAYTGNRDVVIPAESLITFRLSDSLRP